MILLRKKYILVKKIYVLTTHVHCMYPSTHWNVSWFS